MNDLENMPDEFWRKAFEGADEAPPQRIWAAIEHQLDDDRQTRVLPLWVSSALVGGRIWAWGTGVAAGVALVLVGWWYSNSVKPAQPGQLAAIHRQVIADHAASNLAALPDRQLTPAPAQSTSQFAHVRRTEERNHARTTGLVADNHPAAFSNNTIQRNLATVDKVASHPDARFVPQSTLTITVIQSQLSFTQADEILSGVSSMMVQTRAMPVAAVSFNELAVNPVSLRTTRPIDRIVWISPGPSTETAAPAEHETKSVKKEKWASLSLMPGAYNPMVALASAPSMAQNAMYQTTTASGVDSRSSRSITYQVSAGVQLTDRWSVETGVGYLAAQSTVESPAQVVMPSAVMNLSSDAQPTSTNNLFVDAIRSSQRGKSANVAAASQNDYTASYQLSRYSGSEKQQVSNDYQFVQVPVQVGYQLRPRKRLGLALIGGFLTNIFVRNTVGNQVVVTPTDDIYRSLSWSASVGARFRYRPSRSWSASLAGLYQPTIGSGTTTGSPVEAHPTSAGMSFGVDYHF